MDILMVTVRIFLRLAQSLELLAQSFDFLIVHLKAKRSLNVIIDSKNQSTSF